jgi:hypothetical protein
MMPCGEACHHPATLTFHTFNAFVKIPIKSVRCKKWRLNPEKVRNTHNIFHICISSTFINQISHYFQMSIDRCQVERRAIFLQHSHSLTLSTLHLREGGSNQNVPMQNGLRREQRILHRSINQIHSHYSEHLHQLRIPPSDIAPYRNAHSVTPSGEVSNHTATIIVHTFKTCKNGNQIKSNQINQIHSHYLAHSHLPCISQSNIAPRPNVHWMLQSGQACDHAATITFHTLKNTQNWIECLEC